MPRYIMPLLGGAGVLFAAGVLFLVGTSPDTRTSPLSLDMAATSEVGFVPNLGSAPADAFFYLRTDDAVVFLKSRTIEVLYGAQETAHRIAYLVGASYSPRIEGLSPLGYTTGFRQVRYSNVYRGIDVEWDAAAGGLAGRLIVSPNADLVEFLLVVENGASLQQEVAEDTPFTLEAGPHRTYRLHSTGGEPIEGRVSIAFELAVP